MNAQTPTLVLESPRPMRSTLLVLLAAFLIQALLLFVALPGYGGSVTSEYSVGFGDLYDLIANNLAQGNGYRIEANMGQTMMREPGYPLFLLLVFKIGGYHIESARVANLLLSVGIAFMMMRLARRVTNHEPTALIATLLFLFYPGTLIAEARGGVEIIFIFVVMLFMLMLHHAIDKGDIWRYLIAGLMLGAVVMVRSTPLLFPVFVFIYLFFSDQGARQRVRVGLNIAVLMAGMVLVMLPWVVRNYVLVHQLVPTATVQGVAAQEGQYTCQWISSQKDFRTAQREASQERNELARQLGAPFEGWYYQYFFTPQDELAFNRMLMHKVSTEYRQAPGLLVECSAKNLFNFWFLGKTWQATWQNAVMQVPLLVLALGGIYLLRKRALLRNMGIMLMFVLYILFIQAPIIAHARHSIPVVPFLAILASVSLVSIWQAYKARTPKGTAVAC